MRNSVIPINFYAVLIFQRRQSYSIGHGPFHKWICYFFKLFSNYHFCHLFCINDKTRNLNSYTILLRFLTFPLQRSFLSKRCLFPWNLLISPSVSKFFISSCAVRFFSFFVEQCSYSAWWSWRPRLPCYYRLYAVNFGCKNSFALLASDLSAAFVGQVFRSITSSDWDFSRVGRKPGAVALPLDNFVAAFFIYGPVPRKLTLHNKIAFLIVLLQEMVSEK